jgi:hypothetical protein
MGSLLAMLISQLAFGGAGTSANVASAKVAPAVLLQTLAAEQPANEKAGDAMSPEDRPNASSAPAKSIGQATMNDDGTIVLDLRAEGPKGMLGDARFIYPPDHKDYQMILKHLGGLKPGESKPVPPWP